ncbi:MAG: TOBE domain-containing protein [Candidatus Omnitrophica bacterium]|nr:TOBE domain-containing protein [Candidatus Omnitrophota bacterium]
MNKLTGKIVALETSPHMSMVDVDVDGDVFCSIVLETPASAAYLKQGQPVTLLFKEAEVSIGKNLSGLISLRNRFKGTVKQLEKSPILTKVFLEYKKGQVVSIISTRSAQKLALAPGDEVEWLVKTNEVSLLNEV